MIAQVAEELLRYDQMKRGKMDKAAALLIAKTKRSTAEQLSSAMGHGPEVDRLLVKHPNTTGDMLEDLCSDMDEKMTAAVLMHPNVVDTDLLKIDGGEYPLAMFKNPALPDLLKKNKNFLGQFEGEIWEKAFKSKELPDFVVDWLLAQGKANLQIIFFSNPNRPSEIKAKFRESKHASVVAALLDKDVSTLAAWMMDLRLHGLAQPDQDLATLKARVEVSIDWLARTVAADAGPRDPSIAGLAPLPEDLKSTFQSIEDRFFKNGNTDAEEFYKNLCDWFRHAFVQPPTFSKLVQKIISFDLSLIQQYGSPKRIKAAKESIGNKYFKNSGVQRSLTRVQAVLAVWCMDQTANKISEVTSTLNGLLVDSSLPMDAAQSKAAELLKVAQARWRSNYLAWAKDLGFDPSAMDGLNDGALVDAIDEWVEDLSSYNTTLWEQLVPKSGPAPTVQGELVRALGRIETEYFRNGMMNWGDGYYETLVKFIHATLKKEKYFTKHVISALEVDIADIKLSGSQGRASARGKGSSTGSLGGSFFVPSDVEKSHKRIGALITIWCRMHPDLIPLRVDGDDA